MRTKEMLSSELGRLDGKGYKAYNDLRGAGYDFGNFTFLIEHVQSDPFAPPSSVSAEVPMEVAGIPGEMFSNKSRKTAIEDFLLRVFHSGLKGMGKGGGSGKSGIISIAKPSQAILQRSAIEISEKSVIARFFVGLPAFGRRIAGRQAQELLLGRVPEIVKGSLLWEALDEKLAKEWAETNEDADYIRGELAKRKLVAFVADNSLLPRKSGVDERPMEGGKRFVSPKSMEVEFKCPNRTVKGMGIGEGVTLIVGGGYHGKTTLLNAVELGCYNHIPGDGREFVIAREDVVKIRAEDGRYVESVDLSPFISNLPNRVDTSKFGSENASGSTSQAANISEALEAGSKFLAIDEDTSATNFMIRDERMQALVGKDKEPITPLVDAIRAMHEQQGISVLIVMGGSGDFFGVADNVIMMDSYEPGDATKEAKEIALGPKSSSRKNEFSGKIKFRERLPIPESISAETRGRTKIKSRETGISFGVENIDMARVEQMVESGQMKSIGEYLNYLGRNVFDGKKTLGAGLNELGGQEWTLPIGRLNGAYVKPRRFETAAALNRLRTLKCRQK